MKPDTFAIWDWEREPQPPSARVVVCTFGDEEFCRLPADRRREIQRLVVDEPAGRVFVSPHRPDALYPGHPYPAHIIPALYAERQADLAGVRALLAVQAERRTIVLCPREAMDLREHLPQLHWNDPRLGLRTRPDAWGAVDLVVVIPPPETECVTCRGLGHPSEDCNGRGRIEPWPLHPAWVRGIVEQCRTAGVPAVFLGWGRWLPWSQRPMDMVLTRDMLIHNGAAVDIGGEYAWPVGEERSGRLLGGVEVMDLPEWLT